MRVSVAPPWKMPPDRGTAARSAEEIGCRFRVRRTTEADTSSSGTESTGGGASTLAKLSLCAVQRTAGHPGTKPIVSAPESPKKTVAGWKLNGKIPPALPPAAER